MYIIYTTIKPFNAILQPLTDLSRKVVLNISQHYQHLLENNMRNGFKGNMIISARLKTRSGAFITLSPSWPLISIALRLTIRTTNYKLMLICLYTMTDGLAECLIGSNLILMDDISTLFLMIFADRPLELSVFYVRVYVYIPVLVVGHPGLKNSSRGMITYVLKS